MLSAHFLLGSGALVSRLGHAVPLSAAFGSRGATFMPRLGHAVPLSAAFGSRSDRAGMGAKMRLFLDMASILCTMA